MLRENVTSGLVSCVGIMEFDSLGARGGWGGLMSSLVFAGCGAAARYLPSPFQEHYYSVYAPSPVLL